MKIITIILIVLGTCNLMAKEAWIRRLKPVNKDSSIAIKGRDKNDVLEKLIENNKRLNELLRTRSSHPIIWEGQGQILTGKTFRVTLLNTIVSTNQASPVLVAAKPGQGLPFNSKFSCQALAQNKRVFCLCNKLITSNTEIPIQAQLLNLDGSSGLEGQYEDGREELIAGAVISNFSQGMLSAAKDRVSTPFGEMQGNSPKNQILQGAINSGHTTTEILLDEMNSTVPVITIEAGTEVLIYFMEAINEN